ncbi:hypothetical protein [Paraflavitalea sp. CAU 1676]|uniref:hypothetical protein n=1 Tax=Paraflavitalea sp. CAU 1676 TaxID=3032598 RepID=UPI0023DA1F45|nr:hypothetical protein [Paraflavitalea sp. CAU 1676]MDF2193512.1 hypothetical protein [Paraflavitalea sp. CAU 1676]
MSELKEFTIFKHLAQEHHTSVRIADKMYSANVKGPQPATGKVLHFWGQFTSELPVKFQPNGEAGHQYMECSSKEEADKLCQELKAYIFQTWPDSIEWASDGWYRWMIHDMRQMTLQFENKMKKK